MSSILYTPGGDIIHTAKKGQVLITPREMKILADFHELAGRLGIQVICPRCQNSFHGANADGDPTYSVSCRCREIISRGIAR